MKPLYFPVRSSSGRNNLGRLISFRKGGGLKRKMFYAAYVIANKSPIDANYGRA